MSMGDEPKITINGHELTEAQAMTVRVAVNSFLVEMSNPGALGHDDQGRAIANGYRKRAKEILWMMAGGRG